MKMKKLRSIAKNNRSVLWLLAVTLLLLLIYFISPFRFCLVPTGSMEPTIPTKSFCILRIRVPYESIRLGDIVVYDRPDGIRIIHRVVADADGALVTKGDANSIDDGPSVTPDNLFGKYLFYIPYLGKPIALLKTPAGLTVIALVLIALVLWPIGEDGKKTEDSQEDRGGQK